MAMNIAPLNQDQHAALKLKPGHSFAQVKTENIVPVVVQEFTLCAAECPIVFTKNRETGKFQPVAMLGFKPGENLFARGEKWAGMFMPGIVATYPFRIVPHSQKPDQLFVALDMDSDLLSESEGEPLFDAERQETELLAKRRADLTTYYEYTLVTENFCKLLEDMDLFVLRSLDLNVGDEKMKLENVYLIDEEKLRTLSDEKYLELRKRGFLPLIYAQANSLHQIRRLAEMKLGYR